MEKIVQYLAPLLTAESRKAWAGALAAAIATAIPLSADGFTVPEILTVFLALFGTLGSVYVTTNAPSPDALALHRKAVSDSFYRGLKVGAVAARHSQNQEQQQ